MTARYIDQSGVLVSLASVTNIQPVGTLQLLLETSTTKVVIKITQLVDIV